MSLYDFVREAGEDLRRAKPEQRSRCGRSLFEPENQDPQVPRLDDEPRTDLI